MERISLSYFVDFVLKAGTPKLTGVRELKENRDEAYSDFYKPIREAILDMHRRSGAASASASEGGGAADPQALDRFVASLRDERRRRIYPPIVEGYRRFLGQGRMSWFEPPIGAYPVGDVRININPELGLVIDGTPHLIKMYFRGEPLSAKRVAVTLNLVTAALARGAAPGTVFAMLDVRKARLHTLKALNPRLALLLRGEAASFSTIYQAL